MNSEIHLNEPFGREIYGAVKKYNLKNNLEIGSWDGEGSTNCFVQGMLELSNPELLACVEIDKQKINSLANKYTNIQFVKPILASSIGYQDLIYKDFEEIWNSPFFKGCKSTYPKTLVKSWFDEGIELLKKVKHSALDYYKDKFWDSILIDGNEFTGYSEYLLIKNKCKVLFLDDVHKAFKCYQVYDELKQNSSWKLIKEDSNVRNGYAIFIKEELL